MYRVVLECRGIPQDEGGAAALDIAKEFAEHRPYHLKVTCTFLDGTLTLTAENDFDREGLALMDEFSDCLSAYTSMTFDCDISVKSVSIVD